MMSYYVLYGTAHRIYKGPAYQWSLHFAPAAGAINTQFLIGGSRFLSYHIQRNVYAFLGFGSPHVSAA
jgi:hypothetical protein